MTNEQQQIIDEAYENYSKAYEKDNSVGLTLLVQKVDGRAVYIKPDKEMFVTMCTYDESFSEKWGLKIEERGLSLEERWDLSKKYGYRTGDVEIPSPDSIYLGINERQELESLWNDPVIGTNLPTKLITVTYKDKTIESYE